MPTPLKPVRLPAVRDRLVRHLRHDDVSHRSLQNLPPTSTVNVPGIDAGRPGEFAVQLTGPLTEQQAAGVLTHIADELADADLYWISDQFTNLIVDAAQKLPDLRFYPDEVPAHAGLVYFAASPHLNTWDDDQFHPGGQAECDAISWFTTPHGVWVNVYASAEKAMPGLPRDAVREKVGFLMPHSPGGGAPFGTFEQRSGGGYRILAILLATWFLIAQPGVADDRPASVDRDRQRAYARAGRRYPDVHVVNLRRRPTPEGHAPIQKGRSYSVRFIVEGHWRDQPYGPGRALRRRQFIDSYLKGPDDAPVKAPSVTVKKVE